MLNEIKKDAQTRMAKSVEALRHDLTKLRTGRATTALVDHLNRNSPLLDDMVRASERMEDIADDVRRHRDALLARERRSDAAVAALVSSHNELRTAVGVLQQATQQLKRELSRPSGGSTDARPSAPAATHPATARASTQYRCPRSGPGIPARPAPRGTPSP